MQTRTLSRELALFVLGQCAERERSSAVEDNLETLLQRALDSLMQHWREVLDHCASDLEKAQQSLLDSELQDGSASGDMASVRSHLRETLTGAEQVLNGLSASLELPRLLALADQRQVREEAMLRIQLVLKSRERIDEQLDGVMEGWRLSRLPRIDRDILRLAVVDLRSMNTPASVACSEAVELANRYSDEQGRRMINGVLRRLQNATA
tara:strand:- start:2484 stop:3110 length:627 start_codon:yes stop_codon:yes gene_type:complete